jgi:hypothetical protein
MPSLKEHCTWDRKHLGEEYPLMHKAIDYPGLFLGKILPKEYGGPRHRRFGHTPQYVLLVAPLLYPNDAIRATIAGMMHLWLDQQTGKKPSARAT